MTSVETTHIEFAPGHGNTGPGGVASGVAPETAPQAPSTATRQDQPPVASNRSRRFGDLLFLFGLLLIAFFLRTANINFDQGQHQHPDERFWSFVLNDAEWPDSVGDYLSSTDSTLNPYNDIKEDGTGYPTFSYGTMPLYATKAASQWLSGGSDKEGFGRTVTGVFTAMGVDLRNANGDDLFNDRYEANLIGRLLSAILDTMTVGLVFFLARSISPPNYRRAAGFIAAALYAFAPLPIQYAHFLGAEPWVAFFVTATLLGSVRIAKGWAGPFTYLLTGLAVGLAIASKLSGLPAAIAPITAVCIASATAAMRARDTGWTRRNTLGTVGPWVGLGAMAITGFAVFRVALPYAFRDGVHLSLGGLLGRDWGAALGLDERYTSDMAYIRDVNTGGGFNWVIQWAGRTPLLFPLQQLFKWGMGPALTLACLVGIVVALWRVVRSRQFHFLVPLSVIAVFVAFVALQFNPLNRYLLPAYPAAVALAGFGMVHLWRSARPSFDALPDDLFVFWRYIARGSVIAMVGFAVLFGAAFVNGVYGNEYTRIEASHWLVDNIPQGAAISSQAWDDALPLTLPETPDSVGTYGWWDNFSVIQFDPFFPDSSRKVTELVAKLDEVDYVVEASNKLYGAIPQMPAKFPATVSYYDALFDGSLGFEKVAEFTSPPSLFGIQLDDRFAEETFTVYDHPPVTVWQKTDRYSTSNALFTLDPYRADIAVDHQPRQASANALQLTPAAYETQQNGGTWTDTFSDDGMVTKAPWFWWLLWLQIAAFAAVPLTTWLFRALPDHGYGLSKIVGLVLVGLPVFMLASSGLVNFSDTLVWVVLFLLVLAGAQVARKRSDFQQVVTGNWRSWAAAEALFLSVFFAMVLLRYANPDIWHPYRGGEKPMELSYLTAIIKSTTLPAYDPWFAGGFLNYYYVGWFFLAVPAKALHMPPDITFNLGLATYAAVAASVVYSLVSNMAGAARGNSTEDAVALPADRRPSIKAGVLAVFMFMLLGNLDSARQTIVGLRRMSTWEFRRGERFGSVFETIGGVKTWLLGGEGDPQLAQFDWWAPSRVNKDSSYITEFPAWSFLFGDLHPHLMGMAFLGLMLAMSVALVMTLQHPDGRFGARTWVLAAALGAGAAVVRMVHTWDWPTSLVVGGAAIALGWYISDASSGLRKVGATFAQLVVFGVSYLFFSAPYRGSSEVFSSGFQIIRPSGTHLDDFVTHFALFIVAAALYFVVRWRQIKLESSTWTVAMAIGLFFSVAFLVLHRSVGSVAAWSAIGLGLALMLLVAELGRGRESIGHTATAGFFALGFGILTTVEIVKLASDGQGWNTIFKFWLQVWQLFAIAGAFAIWWVLRSLGQSIAERRTANTGAASLRLLRTSVLGGLAVLVLLALVFPFRGIPQRVNDDASFQTADGGLSLEGFRWLDYPNTVSLWDVENMELQQDGGIVDWLRTNVKGSPTVVEAWGPGYQWFNRISMTTGLPGVLGWDWHQSQQRACTAPGEYCTSPGFRRGIDVRKEAIKSFYTVPDELLAERFLLTYDVKYVIIGATENALRKEGGNVVGPVMGEDVRDMFASMPSLIEVYRDGPAVIYEVEPEALRQGKYTFEAVNITQR